MFNRNTPGGGCFAALPGATIGRPYGAAYWAILPRVAPKQHGATTGLGATISSRLKTVDWVGWGSAVPAGGLVGLFDGFTQL